MPKSALVAVFVFLFVCPMILKAQVEENSNLLVVGAIRLHGNEKTKDYIVFRELGFKTGDTLTQKKLLELRNLAMWQVYGLSLFTSVDIEIQNPDANGVVAIDIYLKERWYFFAVPILEIAERNFNSWWTSGENRIHRINYGTRFTIFNLRGRNETMRISLQAGFTRKFSLDYLFPYINKKLTLGTAINFTYSDNREIGYATIDNKLEFFRFPGSTLHKRTKAGITFIYRPKLYTTHSFDFGYNSFQIGDTIARLNPNYFLNNNLSQQFILSGYNYTYDQRNSPHYPLKGMFFQAHIGHFTFITPLAPISTASSKIGIYKPLGGRHFANLQFSGKVSNRAIQPYNIYKALGYGDDVRGYEYYVIDGQHFGLIKTNYIFNLLKQRQYYINNKIKFKKFTTIPFALYGKAYIDAGYVYAAPQASFNTLQNKTLLGYGVGIDIITYYDRAFTIEYSLNNIGKRGLFLRYSISF